jgi:hypothetical protein
MLLSADFSPFRQPGIAIELPADVDLLRREIQRSVR